MTEIEKLNLESADLVAERIAQLKALFPEAFGEGGIDFDKLRLLLGDEVDEGTERYGFTWPGKRDAIRQSQTPSRATLRPAPEESVDWDTTQNLYIEGDNLEVLKLLQRAYHGKVKLIYIDPPYNTGNDFVYKDSFGDSIENYRRQAGLGAQSNPDTSGRFHSDWCSMLYPRLRLARELLKDEGIIFDLLKNPVKILTDDNNNVIGMEVVEMELSEAGEDGRKQVVEKKDSLHRVDCDMVVMALGTSPNHEALKMSNIELSDRGLIVVDGSKTSLDKVYAGGDAVTGAATVILAMEAGKKAAKEIMEKIG